MRICGLQEDEVPKLLALEDRTLALLAQNMGSNPFRSPISIFNLMHASNTSNFSNYLTEVEHHNGQRIEFEFKNALASLCLAKQRATYSKKTC